MAWRRELREAAGAIEVGPPCWGEPRGARMLLTDDGFAHLVLVALRRHNSGIGLARGPGDRPGGHDARV